MKKAKLFVAILSAALISTASIAGDLSVTGNVKATMNISGSDSAAAKQEAGRTLSVENEILFSGTGELDNGTTWKYSMQLEGGAVDDPTITLTNGLGTIGFFQLASGLNAKHYGSAMAIGYGSTFGRGNGTDEFIDPYDIGGLANIQYHTPAGLLPFGTVIKAAKAFSGAGTNKPGDAPLTTRSVANAENYSIELAPIEGLGVSASYYTEDNISGASQTGQEKEAGAIGVKYAFGNFSAGYTRGYAVPALLTTNTDVNLYTNTSYSAGLKVNDNLSVSYGKEKSVANYTVDATADRTTTIDAIQAAYTMGGLTAAVSIKNVDNLSYSTGATAVDTKEATFFLTLAF